MKKIITIIVAIMVFAQTSNFVWANAEISENTDNEVHVSVLGNDSNPGTKERPVATIAKAKKLVTQKRINKNIPFTVIIHEGTYRLTESVNFISSDSGTKNGPITYKGADGEKVVIKGSKKLDISKFKRVTDVNVLNRIPESARNNVAVMDLKAQGITKLIPVDYDKTGAVANNGTNLLYFDGLEQTIARFPNFYFSNVTSVKDAKTKTFTVKESNILRWGTAKDALVAGYLLNDYRYERERVQSIKPEERSITLGSGSWQISGAGRRWFIYNLLEELDLPGEYYIDRENCLLYYYPQYVMSNEALEISTLQTSMFILNDVHFVNFENLEFAQSCRCAFEMASCSDLSFDNCTFKDIHTSAIKDYLDDYRDYQKTATSYNISIKNCILRNIGFMGIDLKGGEEETLTKSGNIVENCYFTEVGTQTRSYKPAVAMAGVGLTVKNNTIHNAAVHLIQGGGSLHEIKYNELYDACKETHDVGVIYAGRNKYQRGVEVSYNYFHDSKCTDKSIGIIACGVYMDDMLSEWNINHNIFEGFERGFFTGGTSSTVENNIFVDCPIGVRISMGQGNDNSWQLNAKAQQYAQEHPIYKEVFPNIFNDCPPNDPDYWAHSNRLIGNLFVNSGKEWSEYVGSHVGFENVEINNIETENFDDFVDKENRNYEIKPGAEILKTAPGLKDISLDKVGISDDMWKKAFESCDNDIIRTYPRNGAENVNSAEIQFTWTKSGIYDKYRLQIATDPGMKNIVIDELLSYNYFITDELEAGTKTYYWTVDGVDISSKHFEDKASVGKPYKFTTSKYENTDKIFLQREYDKGILLSESLVEGTSGGECKIGSLTEYKSILEKAKKMLDNKYASQREIDDTEAELIKAGKKLSASRNREYVSVGKWIEDKANWVAGNDSEFSSDGAFRVNTNEWGFYQGEELKGYQIAKFKMRADFEKEWTGFGLRHQTGGIAYVVGGYGYMIIVKENSFELQRYVNGRGGMLKEVPMRTLEKEKWHEVEVGALDEEDGIRLIYRVDGKTYLNYLDTDGIITESGYLQIYNRHSERNDNWAEIAPSDEDISIFDENILTGRLKAEIPVLTDGYKALFVNEENIKTYKSSYRNNNGVISFKANSGEKDGGTLSSYGTTVGNEVFDMDIKFNLGDRWQGIGLRCEEYENVPWKLNGYLFVVKDDSIELQRYTENGATYLAIANNEFIKSGEYVNLTVGAYPVDKGMRVLLYAGDKKIIDYIDPISVHQPICVNFYDVSGKGMEIRAVEGY